jgi:hypothetical protein
MKSCNIFCFFILTFILTCCGSITKIKNADNYAPIKELSYSNGEGFSIIASEHFHKLFADGEKSLPLLILGLDDKSNYTGGCS